jgi:hypothetical protein
MSFFTSLSTLKTKNMERDRMANLRTEVQADQKPEVTRLGRREMWACVHTWKTRVLVHLNADGSGFVRVLRYGAPINKININAEVKEQ